MAVHAAILLRRYINAILDGDKTVESRLTVRTIPPFGCIAPGDRVYFKASSGPFLAHAIAGNVDTFDKLTPAKVRQLRRRFERRVGGDDDYWTHKEKARHATFVELLRVQPIERGPRMAPSRGLAWFVLDDDEAPPPPVPRFVCRLTAGAVRNAYVVVPPGWAEALRREGGQRDGVADIRHHGGARAPRGVELLLPDGESIATDLLSGGRLRWRGWRRLFDDHHVAAGDRVCFERTRGGQYRVEFDRRARR